MFKQKGIKKPTCQNMNEGVTLTGKGKEIKKERAGVTSKKNAEKVLNQPIKLRQIFFKSLISIQLA